MLSPLNMETIIKISELIGAELRSRSEAKKISSFLDFAERGKIIISFSGVTFISRSFADEFCGIVENAKLSQSIELIDKCNNVEITLSIVLKNRKSPKNVTEHSDTKEFSDMDSLSKFLATI